MFFLLIFAAVIASKHSTFIVSHSHSSAISVNCPGFLSRSLSLCHTLSSSLRSYWFCFSNCLSRVQMNSPLCVQFESFLQECVCVSAWYSMPATMIHNGLHAYWSLSFLSSSSSCIVSNIIESVATFRSQWTFWQEINKLSLARPTDWEINGIRYSCQYPWRATHAAPNTIIYRG